MFRLLLALAACGLVAGVASAQQRGPAMNSRWPSDAQQLPAQDDPAPEARSSAPAAAPARVRPAAPTVTVQAAPAAQGPEPAATTAPPHRAAPPKPAAPARAITCGGVFAKESSHLKLAQFFGSDNLVWGQVDGPEGSQLNASILYPKDPRRRLEVLWQTEASRSDTQLIVINGHSNWTAPKGLRLGLTVAALEKINGKPFRIHGFGKKDGGGSVTSWDGGTLDSLPGGCKIGIHFVPDPKAPEKALAEVTSDKELLSSLPAFKQAAPKVDEIIIGY